MVCLRTFLLDMRRHAIKCHVPTIHRGLPSNLSRLALTRRAQSPQIAIWKRPYRAHRVQYTPRSGLIEDWKHMKMWANTHNIPFMMNMWCAYAFRLRSCVSMLLYGITANVILLSLQMQQQWLQHRRLEAREKKHAETRHSSFVERKPFSLFCCPCSIYENGERERVRSCVSVFVSMWFELCDCFCCLFLAFAIDRASCSTHRYWTTIYYKLNTQLVWRSLVFCAWAICAICIVEHFHCCCCYYFAVLLL